MYARTTIIRGRRPDEECLLGERPRTWGSGRVCATPGCGTVLSSYNPSALCSLHSAGWRVGSQKTHRHYREREELQRRCANECCNREFATTNPARKFCSDRCRMQAFQARRSAEVRRAQVA